MTDKPTQPAKAEILRALYRAVDWSRLYELLPGVTREQVDALFAELRETVGGAPSPDVDVSGGAVDVYCDGASRGNPGPAGLGVVVRTPDGREVAAWGDRLGRATNNVAEYMACIAGLRRTRELGAQAVRVLSDSELLVRQITGRYRVRNAALQPLHAQVMDLLGSFESWEAVHIPREQNTQADRLATQAAKRAKR